MNLKLTNNSDVNEVLDFSGLNQNETIKKSILSVVSNVSHNKLNYFKNHKGFFFALGVVATLGILIEIWKKNEDCGDMGFFQCRAAKTLEKTQVNCSKWADGCRTLEEVVKAVSDGCTCVLLTN